MQEYFFIGGIILGNTGGKESLNGENYKELLEENVRLKQIIINIKRYLENNIHKK